MIGLFAHAGAGVQLGSGSTRGLGTDRCFYVEMACATGVYHAASNTLNEVLYEVGQKLTAEEFLSI